VASDEEPSPRAQPPFRRTTKNSVKAATPAEPASSSTSPVALAREIYALQGRKNAQAFRSSRHTSLSGTSSHIAPPENNQPLRPQGTTSATRESAPSQNQTHFPEELIQPSDMVDKKKIPESYEKNAPRFDDENPDELPQFLEYVERMMELEETADAEKNAFVCRYTSRKTREEWKRFETYDKSYKEFKKEILENYPSSVDRAKGSMLKLRRILSEFPDGDISMSDQDELMKLTRQMNSEASKLMESKMLADSVAVAMFLDKLTNRFREKILDNLERAPAAEGEEADSDPEERNWTLKEVTDEAKRIAKRQNKTLEYLHKSSRGEKPVGRSSSPRPVKQEEAANATAMLESIKLSVVNMMDRLEAQTTQKLSQMDETNRKKLAELEQFYKSLPGRVAGAPDSQTLPPRPTVRFRAVQPGDLCHYCAEAGSHWISNCPHRAAHLAGGHLKVLMGKDCYPNGVPLPMYGPKSKKQLIDEYIQKQTKTQNVQTALVQRAAGGYQLDLAETVAIEEDDVDSGYHYYDPAEYDPRDDEIQTMRVEQANLLRQLAQHQTMQLQPRQSRAIQQAPSTQQTSLDVNFVSTLLAATLAKAGNLNQPMEQNVQTRANPSRTGNSSETDKDFI
jgi:hypothetical protein